MARAPCLPLQLSDCAVFVNDERTRTFASLLVSDGADGVRRLILACDAALHAFGMPPYYKVPVHRLDTSYR